MWTETHNFHRGQGPSGYPEEAYTMSIYLDYQSSKPVDPRVVEAVKPYFGQVFGNPSSLHKDGDEAEKALAVSRKAVADFINAGEDEIIFTSGATESNNLAIIGYALRNKSKGKHIIISEIEHISIQNIAKFLEKEGFTVSRIPVDFYGRINMEKLKKRIQLGTILISVSYASNEIGTIQPIREIGELAREQGVVFHVDAVAAESLIPIDVEKNKIDLLTLSSNDIYGPRGLGALYIRNGIKLKPVIIGGGQENGLRSGSEDVASIVGMAEAARIMSNVMDEESERFAAMRDRLIMGILEKVSDSHLNGHPTVRLPNNAHFRFDGIEGESIILSLKDKDISASTGSACSAKTLEPSHTLIATGLLHEEAHGSLEFSLGRWTTDEDIDKALEAVPGVVKKLREMSPLYKIKV